MKIVKEVIIMLLVCLVLVLILGLVFYEYRPNNKVVSEVSTYAPTALVKKQLADDITKQDSEVILTFEQGGYEVTSTDLNRYKNKNIYVPGKANPFAASAERVTGETDTNSSTTSTSANATTNSKSGNTSDSSNEYIRNKGTK